MYFNGQDNVKLTSGQEMPVIGLGTSSFTDNEVEDVFVRAITEIGYRHIDTASFYKNEEQIGRALKKVFDKGIKRESLFITTKCWNEEKGDPRKALKASLDRLGLDYVDMYLFHWPANYIMVDGNAKTMKWPLSKTWEVMEQLVDEGLTKNIGLSNYNCQLIYDLLTYCRIRPACNQIELNPYLRQKHLTKWLNQENIIPVAYCPLGNPGTLDNDIPSTKHQIILELAQKYNKSPAAICLNWGLSQNHVVIPKSSNYDRLKDNFESGNFKMSLEDIERINKLDKNLRRVDLLADGYYGVPLFS